MKIFDLNINEILENWKTSDAIRELISNALDETKLSNSKDIKITKLAHNIWEIRDFGRGIHPDHFEQNENYEKLEVDGMIGKFGVGLKDAIATFYRRNIDVIIKSKYGEFTFKKISKPDYPNNKTIHAIQNEVNNKTYIGTSIILKGVSEEEIESAKSMFLYFRDFHPLDTTEIGEIYANDGVGEIFLNGLKIGEEENFLFSYNITSLTKKIKLGLNRERKFIGRDVYSDRIKSIILKSSNEKVLELLVAEIEHKTLGSQKDELNWQDIQLLALENLNIKNNYIFMTEFERSKLSADLNDLIYRENKKVIVVPEAMGKKIKDRFDSEGAAIVTFESFMNKQNESFKYEFVQPSCLRKKEKAIFNLKDIVCKKLGFESYSNKIFISKTMKSYKDNYNVLGEYHVDKDVIIIKRKVLENKDKYLGVLIHELIHANTGTEDVTREFENELTKVIGLLASDLFSIDRWWKFK